MSFWSTQPSIYLGSLRVDEPVTMLTDVLVTVVCWYAAWRLRKHAFQGRLYHYLFWFFVLMGAGTLLGGVLGHGFLYAVGFFAKLPGWLVSMVAVNLVERAMIYYSRDILSKKTIRFLGIFNTVELLTFAALAFGTLNFLWVEIHSTYGFLVVVFALSLLNYNKRKHKKPMMYALWAVSMIFICSVVFVVKLAPHQWFNHADLAHVFMAAGAFLFYKAAVGMLQEKSVSQYF